MFYNSQKIKLRHLLLGEFVRSGMLASLPNKALISRLGQDGGRLASWLKASYPTYSNPFACPSDWRRGENWTFHWMIWNHFCLGSPSC